MFDITLEDYKDCLVNLYLCEYDNNDVQKKKRNYAYNGDRCGRSGQHDYS